MKRFKGIVAVVLTVLLIISVIPMNAFALFPLWSTGGEELSVSSLVVDDCYIYENIDGYYDYIYDEATGEYLDEYFYYTYSPTFRVDFLNHGFYEATLIAEDTYGIVVAGVTYQLTFEDTQYEEPWGVGTHTVSATLLDVTVEFNVHVLESPIESVEFSDASVYEDFNCYLDYSYDYETGEYGDIINVYSYIPSCTVSFADGSKCESIDGKVTYNGKEFYIETVDMQYQSPWIRGNNVAVARIFGFEQLINVEVLANPYNSIVIDEDLNITLNRNDGGSEEYKFVDVFPNIYSDDTVMIGALYTDNGAIPGVSLYYGLSAETPVSIAFGSFISNEVISKEFSATLSIASAVAAIKEYRVYSQYILKDTFMGYDSKESEIDVIAMATIAVVSDMEAYYEFTDVVEGDGMYIATVPVHTVKACVEKLFGIANFDVTELSGYNATAQTVELPLVMDILAIKDGDITSADNGYYGDIELYDAYKSDYNSIKVSFSNSGHIEKIEFVGDKIGLAIEKIEVANAPTKQNYKFADKFNAINDAKGLELIAVYEDGSQKIITGGFTFGEFSSETRGETEIEVFYGGKTTVFSVKVVSGDVDGDGNENAADLALLKKVIAGLESLEEENADLADVDLSGGSINAADLALLKKIIAGLEL